MPSTGFHAPLPARQFRRFILVFHAVFLGGLAFTLFLRWRPSGWSWTWRDSALFGLVVLQSTLYLRFFVRPLTGPFAWRRWGGFFIVSFGLWLTEWRIDRSFEWVLGAYLGQMFGVLPPRFSLPASAAAFAAYFSFKFGWQEMARLRPWQWLAGSGIVAGWTALGLFLHKLAVTSSERARLIQELESAKQKLELAGQRDAELAVLRERERLARELHDSLGHALVTLTVQLEAVQRLYPTDPAQAATLIEEMKKLTRASMEDLRRSLANLRAPGLGERPLATALQELCADVGRRSGVRMDCQVAADVERLQPMVAEALWRVAQESLVNMEKHARASQVHLSLRLAEKEVILRVEDDGCGLSPDAEQKPGHFGLRGLRERVEGLGGTFTVEAGGAKGTAVAARIPMIA